MSGDRLLPTPDGSNMNEGQTERAWRTRKQRERAKGYNGNGGGTPLAMAMPLIAQGIDPNDERLLPTPNQAMLAGYTRDEAKLSRHHERAGHQGNELLRSIDERTSACSPESEGSISPPSSTGSSALPRSNGTTPAPESSDDGGRLFPDGEMSGGSPLLPSPTAQSFGTMSSGYRDVDHQGVKKASLEHMVRHPDEWISSSAGSPVSPSAPQDDDAPATTIGGYGPSSPVLLATYDPERSSSRTSGVSYRQVTWTLPQASLFGDLRSEKFWETWPTSGMTRRGRAFALPMSERRIDASGFSYLRPLPTPRANESTGPDLRTEVDGLLPTPGAWLGRRPENSEADPQRAASREHEGIRGKRSVELPEVLEDLLPTPNASDWKGSTTPESAKDWEHRGTNLPEAIQRSRGEPTGPRSSDGSESSDEDTRGPSMIEDG